MGKLILCETNNGVINHLDEITLSANYFVTNKRQATNITFNKIISNDIRIELKLKVSLIAKTIKGSNGNIHSSYCEEDALSKWMENRMDIGYRSQSSACSDMTNSKRRRSGLCANSVKNFY